MKTPLVRRIAQNRSFLILCMLLSVAVFVVDLIMPRTAAPAIFYCGLLAVVGSTGVRRIILPAALFFTLLTWIGAYFEPHGEPIWLNVDDRAMVTGVLWLTALLMVRREQHLRQLDQLTRELARRNAELDQFAGVVAHDIRSPMATAMLYAELLALYNQKNADEAASSNVQKETAEAREVIVRSLREMDQLIRDLLEATRRPQIAGDCDVHEVLHRVLRTMEAELLRSDARVSHDALPHVHADAAQVRQVFQNLIQNAIKYRSSQPPRIHVFVRASDAPGMIQFCVADNGIGVKREDVQRIFNRYEQVSDAQQRARAGGVGLGLSVCRRIIEQHGGHIWVEPPADPSAHGSVFCFTLPAAPAQ